MAHPRRMWRGTPSWTDMRAERIRTARAVVAGWATLAFIAAGCGGEVAATSEADLASSPAAAAAAPSAAGPTLPAGVRSATTRQRRSGSATTRPHLGDPALPRPVTTIASAVDASPTGPSTSDVRNAQKAIDEVHASVGDAYRRLRQIRVVDGGSEALLTSVFTGEALQSQLQFFEQAAKEVDILANQPGDPIFRITAVRATAPDCYVVAGEVDDRQLYAFPDAVAVRPAVARLERGGGVWRISNLIDLSGEGATAVVDRLSCVEPSETRPK